MRTRVTVLGAGFTGTHLIHLLRQRGSEVAASRRSIPPAHTFPGIPTFRFALNDAVTWENIPLSDALVCLFPCDSESLARTFAEMLRSRAPHIVLVGTTSSYQTPPGVTAIDETVPLDQGPRTRNEEMLRAGGALVLRSAGIYGPGAGTHGARNPLDWLRAGWITDLAKTVNLIHVEDLCAAIIVAVDSDLRGEQFIVSDGCPLTWNAIRDWAVAKGLLKGTGAAAKVSNTSRRLVNAKLLKSLGVTLRHTRLFEELMILEGQQRA